MPAFKITVAYDGTGLVGWQRQASGTSVQGLLEDALFDLEGRVVEVTGAGRTDAGVHSLGQAAGFRLSRSFDPGVLVRAVNARLPDAVRIVAAEMVPDDFHARFDATAKTYRYRIWNGDVLPPCDRHFAWHVPGALDAGSMDEAARLLEGRHDFAAFQSTGGMVKSTERVIRSSRVRCEESQRGAPGRSIVYEVTGDGFLRHMVRAIVGSLVEVGRGRRQPAWMRELVTGGDRGLAGPTAPAHGLFLVGVRYEREGAATAVARETHA